VTTLDRAGEDVLTNYRLRDCGVGGGCRSPLYPRLDFMLLLSSAGAEVGRDECVECCPLMTLAIVACSAAYARYARYSASHACRAFIECVFYASDRLCGCSLLIVSFID
jgi:hypothetical protein